MAVDVTQIGLVNMQLVLDLAQDRGYSSGYPIEQFEHAQDYNYDLSYGVSLHLSHRLQGRYVGKKYYCYRDLVNIDMQKRIVHIFDQDNKKTTQKFYRLIHTAAKPGLNDNSYDRIDEITNIDQALQKAREDFQAELRKGIAKLR
jgi:hypothetical protein